MSTVRYFCPLFLLFVVWTFPSRVQCQEVKVQVDLVSTYYLQVSWPRFGDWLGVTDYSVIFIAENSNICEENITCNTPTCTFNTLLYCGFVLPCTSTNITVSGAGHTAPSLSLVTGPEPVTDFSHYITDGVEYVSWVNPSIVTSPCYNNTALRFFFNNKEEITNFELDEDNMSKPLCVSGYGEVEVWAEGGDGRSNSSLGTIIYNTSVVDLVTSDSCQPVGCNSIGVQWFYNPVCTDVAYIELELEDVKENVSVGTTNHNVTDLTVDQQYHTCIYAKDKDGQTLDSSCFYYHCKTAYEMPRNLVVTSPSTSSLIASWDPPVCKRDNDITYNVRADYTDFLTKATTQTITDLRAFTLYKVKVYVERGHYDNQEREVSTDAFTLPDPPSLHSPVIYDDYIYVSWYFYVSNDYGYEFYVLLTWGKSLEYNTTLKANTYYYYIWDYGSEDDVFQICIVTFPGGREDLTSKSDCRLISDGYEGDPSLSSGAIAGIVISVLFVVVFVAACFAYQNNKSKKANRRAQQQQQQLQQHQQLQQLQQLQQQQLQQPQQPQQQQQQHMQQQHNYGVYNSGAST